jgi:hypothetical protein
MDTTEVNNTMEQSFAERRFVKLYFILKDDQDKEDVSSIFQDAYQVCT